MKKVVTNCLANPSVKTLLDIGTGSGLFAEAFHNAGLKITGIDINKEFIDEAARNFPTIDFKIASAEDLPFMDKMFDASFFGLVIHEVSDYKKALTEAFRVSRHYTFILEWKFITENAGPPIEHRLKPVFIENLSFETGFKKFTEIQMQNFMLYVLRVS